MQGQYKHISSSSGYSSRYDKSTAIVSDTWDTSEEEALSKVKSKKRLVLSKTRERKRRKDFSLTKEEDIPIREEMKIRRMCSLSKRIEKQKQRVDDRIPLDIHIERKCPSCGERVKNGGFLHEKEVHISRCYECAKQFWKTSKSCTCGAPSEMVVKIRLD
uniref:Putative ubiquitin-protein ligase E3 Mdm2 n=1 Tax=Glypta fumiferanae TaxID=389681 RepID=A0A0F6Q8R5_9HYME|nr:putative ubiquitin-protein ligase E3 Mdm2 [Glypta fumiferanae]